MRESRRAPSTLRARLALAAAGAILTAVALFAVATVLLVRHELSSSLDDALRQRAQQVAQLAISAPGVLSSPGALETPVSGRQIAVEVLDARGRIIARSLALGAKLLPQDRLARAARVAGRTGFEDIELAGRRFRLYAAPIADAGGPAAGGAVLVASDTTDISTTIGHLGLVISLIGAAVCVLAALAAAALTRRGLRPLGRLAAAAAEIERTADPSRRLPAPGLGRGSARAGDEVAQLTGVLNRMLAALEESRAGERRFLADASHELRTPVTTLLGNVEFAARHGADDEVLADLGRDAARLARLVDDLLVLERVAASEPEFAPLALGELASDLAGRHERVTVIERAPGVRVRGDGDALRRLLENLIENALVHGPGGGAVTITISTRDGSALVTVEDQGSGPDGAYRERVFERFWRGPDAGERPGSGLGLSIVAAIAQRHAGRVVIEGSAFTVELPSLP
jgi:signal transduction histidine kinase